VTVLATTDLHGNIFPVDYFTNQPAARGLARLAPLIKSVRAENPNTILIDCGDTIQGSPLEYVYQNYVRTGRLPSGVRAADLTADPMMLVMNHLRYDAMALGNHEFNYGLRNLARARADARFPWLSANTRAPADRVLPAYLVKEIAGVKVAIVGITTPAIPVWEKPENIAGYRFEPAVAAVQRAIRELESREKPDAVIAAVHAGLDRDLRTGVRGAGASPGENMVYDLATGVPGLDAIVFGHTHQELEGKTLGKVLLVQPKNWGMSLARIDLVFEGKPGAWRLAQKRSRLLKPDATAAADEEVLRIARPYHEAAQKYLDTPVATAGRSLDGAFGRVRDTALVDAIHEVQLHFAQADVSFASMFNPRVSVPQGPVTVRQIAALYIYDNELYAIEGTGRLVKDALENAARYFLSCAGERCGEGPLTNPRVLGYNFDTAQGIDYEIDLTRPEGDRIRNLRYRGRSLMPDQKLRIAINNYRAAGSAGYGMFTSARIVWRAGEDIRDLMIRYFSGKKRLPSEADGNWIIVPPSARETLSRQAQAEAARRSSY
jgi:2',3'-cyclic-nucleotide 2'-phosphodiesterase/3'-nucleotidase